MLAVVAIACGGEGNADVRQSATAIAETDPQVPRPSVAKAPAAYVTKDPKSIEPHQAENVIVKDAATDPSEFEK